MRRAATLLVALVFLGIAAPARAATLAQIGTFSAPTFLTSPPGDASRLFVVERAGTIRVLQNGTTSPFLDITSRVLSTGTEQGLLSMAFAPDFATSGRYFVYFTNQSGNGDVEIDEYRGPNFQRMLLTIEHSEFANHNGGQLQFGPDGQLYAGTGDGGGGGDPHGNAQNDAVRLGKLLRIDPATGAVSNFARGLRNPWRFSFDRQTGDLVIADVGQGRVEEVDFAAAPGRGQGANYGWNRFEGNEDFSTGQAVTSRPVGFTFPAVTHTHADGWCSITGGYVVRDPGVPELAGRYVYGDYCKGDVYAATLPAACDDGPTGLHVAHLSSFGEDASGRVYALSLDGPVYRLTGTGGPSAGCAGAGGTPGGGGAAGGSAAGGASTSTPADRTAPTLRLVARRRQHSARRLSVATTCNETCRMRIRAVALGRTAALLTNRTLAAGSRVVLRLTVRPAMRRSLERRLRAGRTMTLHLSVTAADSAGNRTHRTLTVRLVR